MPDTNGNECVDKVGRTIYDGRFAALETRTAAVETDVAVIRASFATKDDIQLLRTEMHAGHERILSLLYEHKLQMQTAMSQQRDDFRAALGEQREDWTTALARQREDWTVGLAKQREDWTIGLAKQREDFHAALAKQHDDFAAALGKQRDDFYAMHMQLLKDMRNHTWRLYGFASLVMGGVYFIARYVH